MRFFRAAAATAAIVLAGSVAGASAAGAAPPAPDLVVTSVAWAPTALVTGQQVRFSATIVNRGNAATPAGVVHGVGFQVDGVLRTWSDDWTASLAPGQSVTLTAVGGRSAATWSATSGDHRIRAFVDDAQRMAESNERNNTLDGSFAVASGLALRMRGADVVTTVAPNSKDTVTATSLVGFPFAGCFTADGVLVDGSERKLPQASVGNGSYYPGGGSFGDAGLGQVPASGRSTEVRVGLGFGQLLRQYQGHFAFTCAAGQSPNFTRFQGTSVTTTQFLSKGDHVPTDVKLATVTAPIDMDFDV